MITEDEEQEMLDDDEYPHVVESYRGTPRFVSRALNNVYVAIDESDLSEETKTELALIPAKYVRGSVSASEAKWIIQDIKNYSATGDRIVRRANESIEFIENNA